MVAGPGLLFLAAFWISDGDQKDSLGTGPDSHLGPLTGEEGEPPSEEVLDNLEWIRDHPYDLNRVTEAELEALPGVTADMAASVIRFRKVKGAFHSVDELLRLGAEQYRSLLPYVHVPPTRPQGPPFLKLRLRTERIWSRPDEPLIKSFRGSPWKAYGRLSLSPSRNVEGGVLFERDAGEPVGYAFYSGYLALKELGPVRSLVLGDFVLEAGQGVVLWRESGPGRGSDPVAFAKRSALGVQPYRYSGEVAFFRGIALTLGCGVVGGELRGSVFYSRRSLPGRVDPLGEFLGYHTTGLFRTESEQARLGALNETIFGGRLAYDKSAGPSFGLTCYQSRFSRPFSPSPLKAFSGEEAFVAGLDARLVAGPVILFGEAALSRPRGEALLAGAVLSLSRGSSLGVALRRYSPFFVDIHAHAFGETGSTRNEQGAYLGWSLKLNNWFRLSGSFDTFKTFWRTSRFPLPRRGCEALLRAEVHLTRRSALMIQWRWRQSEQRETASDSLGREVLRIAARIQQNLRLTLTRELGRVVRFRTRVELIDVRRRLLPRHETGILLYQDIRWSIWRWMDLSCRLLLHQTDSYDSRLYAFERALAGVLGLPPLYGRGISWYLFLKVSILDGMSVSLKYGDALRDPIRSAGEHGEHGRERLSLQIDLRL
jgi:hypothetical protein